MRINEIAAATSATARRLLARLRPILITRLGWVFIDRRAALVG
ncbi:hypothetical protein [Nocardioides sp.]